MKQLIKPKTQEQEIILVEAYTECINQFAVGPNGPISCTGYTHNCGWFHRSSSKNEEEILL